MECTFQGFRTLEKADQRGTALFQVTAAGLGVGSYKRKWERRKK